MRQLFRNRWFIVFLLLVYTQLSDVEDEINGLYTYDRQVCKVDAAKMRAILREAEEILRDAVK